MQIHTQFLLEVASVHVLDKILLGGDTAGHHRATQKLCQKPLYSGVKDASAT